MTYRINLPIFEGPMDLMLFLIKKNEIDIYDIPIAGICEEYLGTLEVMQELNLDVAGEFLVMASTLTRIKARMLLPRETEEGQEEDPRAELVQSLLEYQQFKEAAEGLGQRDMLDRDVFKRPGGDEDQFKDKRNIETPASSIFDLLMAFRKVLEGLDEEMIHQVAVDRISLLDRINEMMDMFADGEARPFSSLFAEDRSKSRLVISFLAVLELVRLGMLGVHQSGLNEEIMLLPDKEAMGSVDDAKERIDVKLIEEYH